jgi:uncharacterized protein (TIGR01777 family)
MKLVIAGATGFIGSILMDRLWNQFHDLTLLSRKPPAEVNVTKKQWFAWQPGFGGEWEKAVDGADGIINFAGEPIAGKRWSAAQKEILRSSRTDATKSLVNAIANAKVKPKFLINASAVGYYGPRGEELVTESTGPGHDFLSRLCVEWENEAKEAEALGVRVALLRTGIVLAKGKGALAKIVRPFKIFFGGPLGRGQQWMPWIHIEDEIGLISYLIENAEARGPFNGTAPNPVTMNEFSKTLGDVLNRPSWARVPPSFLALTLGEMSEMLLNGQRAIPEAALKLGYAFKYPELAEGLRALNL